MNGLGKDPAFMLTVALGTFAVGGFIAVSHLGRTSEPVQMKSGFSTRFAPDQSQTASAAPSSYLENFKRGTQVVKARVSAATSGFGFSFGGPAAPVRTASASSAGNESWRKASSGSRGWYADDEGRDWGSSYYKGPKDLKAAGGSASWAASGGASKTGSSAQAPWTAAGSDAADGDSPAGEEMPEVDAAAVARYARAQASPGAAGQAASAMYASASPGRGASYPSSSPGAQSAPGGSYAGVPSGNTGSVSGMRGGVSGADLGGAAESQRSEAMDMLKYRAPGAGGGGEVKAPDSSQLRVVEEGGSSSSGGSSAASGSSGSSAGASGGSAPAASSSSGNSSSPDPAVTPAVKKTAPKAQEPAAPVLYASAQTPDLIRDITSEKLNGKDERYLRAARPQLKSMDDSGDTGLDSLLKPRTVHPSPAPSGSEKSVATEETPDPESLAEVREARREAIKTEIHLFLNKIESSYGKMSDIQRVSCDSDRDTCRDHKLRGSYLTMVTATGAKLALAVKRSDCAGHMHLKSGNGGSRSVETRGAVKWRLYTIDFMDGEGRRPGEGADSGAAEQE